MMINGENNIFGIQSFAVVKCNALAKLESPFCCIGCGIPAFCQFRNRFSIGVDFNQAIPKLPTYVLHKGIFKQGRIQRVGGGTTGDTQPQSPAFFGRCSMDRCAE